MIDNESGRSMIEMLGVLSIMGVIMYGAVAGINYGIEMYKINATYNEVEEISRGILDLYSWNLGFFGGLSNKVLCDNDVVAACSTDHEVITNQWGGSIEVHPTNTNTGFQIIYKSVPYIACFRLTTTEYTDVCASRADCGADDGNSKTITFTLKTASGCS